jgi:signal transduction histidine kinase
MLTWPMTLEREPSALAVAALASLRDVTAPGEVVGYFAAQGATVSEDGARALLDELCALGLARAVQRGGRRRYRATPLGERLLRESFVGRREHADLLADIEAMRTELLSTIAHEMRTPLTAVRTSIGLLLDPAVQPDAEQHRSLLESIDRNATRMQRVVGDILDLARFRAGRVQLQLQRFDAAKVARTAVHSVAPLADVRAQRISIDAPSEPVWVYGDYRRLEQALVNLLANAEKYSGEGTPIVVTVTSGRGEVRWVVQDAGHGIDPVDRARLFERFFVAGRDRSEATAGIGLGLPISLLIAQAHDGRIEVESAPGQGSTFAIVVPIAGPSEVPDE